MLFISNSKHKVLFVIIVVALLAIGLFVFCGLRRDDTGLNSMYAVDHKNVEYLIDGNVVKLKNGIAESKITPDSSAKIITRYFGNELRTDLNNDGREDVAFIVTQETGGSGTFYYVVAALNTENGYIGSDGYFLGDRIAPQTTELSRNQRHKNVVVVNYADRARGEPMITQPSIGKSVYLKLDLSSMMWGIVEPNFEGESS